MTILFHTFTFTLPGLVSTMTILCIVSLGKLLAGTWVDKLGTGGTWHAAGQLPDKESSAQLTQPMLAGISHAETFK